MPELVEVHNTAQMLSKHFQNSELQEINVTGGRYKNNNIKNKFSITIPNKIVEINSKGKLLWFHIKNSDGADIYILNTFGLTGLWTFDKGLNSDINFMINGKQIFFDDKMHYGTIKIVNKIEFEKKINEIGDDLLKTNYDYVKIFNRLEKIKNKDKKILEILMTQTKHNGIGSGLGNYLTSEILFRSKISPHRTIKSLTIDDVKILTQTIKYVLKLRYMTDDFINNNYHIHNDVEIKNEKFDLLIYKKKLDPYGNKIIGEQIIKDRIFFWSPEIQK